MNTKTLLEQIGGQAAIARECDISDSAVSQWAAEDSIPNARSQYLRLAHPGDHWTAYDEYLAKRVAGSMGDQKPSGAAAEHAQAHSLEQHLERCYPDLITERRVRDLPLDGPDRRKASTEKPGRGA